MTIANPQQTKLAAVECVIGSGAQTPSGTISDALLITTDTIINDDQLELNDQQNVVSPSLGKRKTKIGAKGCSVTIGGNLASFGDKASKIPAADPFLRISGYEYEESDSFTFDADATNVAINDLVENVAQTATAKVRAVNGTVVHISDVTGTFTDGEAIQTVVGSLPVGTLEVVDGYQTAQGALYKPRSQNLEIGSIYWYLDGQRRAASDVATNFEISSDSSKFSVFTFTGVGNYDETNWVPAPLPTATYTDAEPSLLEDSEMVLNFGAGDFVPVNTSLTYTVGATPKLRKNSVSPTGLVGGYITSRNDAGLTVVIENETQDEFDYTNTKLNSTSGTVSWRIGDGTAGETIYMFNNVTIVGSDVADDDMISTVTLDCSIVDVTLDDSDGFVLISPSLIKNLKKLFSVDIFRERVRLLRFFSLKALKNFLKTK